MKKKYIKPCASILQVETAHLLAGSGLSRYESAAQEDLEVLSNQNGFTGLWGDNKRNWIP